MLSCGFKIVLEKRACAQRDVTVAQVARNEGCEIAQLLGLGKEVGRTINGAGSQSLHATAELHDAQEPAGILESQLPILLHYFEDRFGLGIESAPHPDISQQVSDVFIARLLAVKGCQSLLSLSLLIQMDVAQSNKKAGIAAHIRRQL